MLVARALTSPTRAVCIREVQKSLDQSVKQLIEDKIGAFGLGDHFRSLKTHIEGPGGGIIIFQGMQDHTAASIKSLEGFDIAWAEEAQTLSDTSLTLLRPTIRKEGSELWFSWNPKRPTDPVDALLRSKTPANSVVVRANYMDNPFLPNTLREELEEDRADEEKFGHVWLGEYELIAKGAYYGKQMAQADRDERICRVPHEPTARVWTAWDLGMNDQTSIWFAQLVGREIRIVDYYEATGEPLSHYVGVIDKKAYNYGGHLLPHDVEARELGTGKSRREVLEGLGLKVLTVPQHTVEDGINAVRSVIPRCWFDKTKAARGIECLQMYRAEWDDKMNTLRSRPLHDEFSHGADAFRYLAMGLDFYAGIDLPKPRDRYRDRRDSASGGSWMSA